MATTTEEPVLEQDQPTAIVSSSTISTSTSMVPQLSIIGSATPTTLLATDDEKYQKELPISIIASGLAVIVIVVVVIVSTVTVGIVCVILKRQKHKSIVVSKSQNLPQPVTTEKAAPIQLDIPDIINTRDSMMVNTAYYQQDMIVQDSYDKLDHSARLNTSSSSHNGFHSFDGDGNLTPESSTPASPLPQKLCGYPRPWDNKVMMTSPSLSTHLSKLAVYENPDRLQTFNVALQ